MDLKSFNRPSIPVRHNRRTQLKPLSRLNGDWLPLLKKIRTSEMSQQVRGHNASEELRTRRLVGQWFGDTAWQLGKLRKAQSSALTDLARLHLERRQLRRHMLLWRQSEARLEAEREREREARREEMERVGAEIERRTRQLQQEGRRMSQRLNQALFPAAGRRASRVVPAIQVHAAPPDTAPAALPGLQEAPDAVQLPAEIADVSEKATVPQPAPTRELSNPLLSAKVLEVTKHAPEPIVRTRTKSDLSGESLRPPQATVTAMEKPPLLREVVETVLNANPVLPPIKASPETHDTLTVPRCQRPGRGKRRNPRCVFPTIDEDKQLDLGTSSASESSSQPSAAPSARSRSYRASSGDRGKQEARDRLHRRKEFEQAVLRLPFTAYRRDSHGHVRALDQPPAPPKFEEPSNRDAYRRSRLLRSEKINCDEKMKNLETFTDNCVQEDMKQLNELQTPKAKPEEAKTRLDEKFDESATLGPADWMRVFLHSTLPEGADPDDPESLHHCRYIRKEEEGEATAGRVSSWDPV